ncbi:DNA cytosine methyltransferase [Nesterenkonia alkaliphila]|uniref:Cytosine-specific methyltransferase n=1 Tax=Nesterenkonia alkaliphila TaxID=1463631 RepID=A0A7K1UG71_9MICC|nr:DNA cytosine methyltransferase [Nesterenkonia alkaliphila]MVT25467.1 DNA (cytosine-5-)-methyltransferase [Nesterenkonia alkaliphila]GFZ80997.1 restriction endonuclease subunit M [Nesterenkonia alkaliphila]
MTVETSNPVINAVDLFCGVGGLTRGLANAGVNVHAGYDIDPACRFPYEANNDSKFVEMDVNDLTAAELRRHFNTSDVSLLAGCAPCQPFSSYARAGRSRKRPNDWQLVETFGQLVKDVQPDLVTMENVPQLVDHSVFTTFLESLEGYDTWWAVMDTASLGVPQTRKRLVLLASKFGVDGLELVSQKVAPVTVRDAIGSLPPIAAGETHPHDRLHTASRLGPKNLERIQHSKPGGTWRDWPEELQAECHRKSSGATYPSVYGRMAWDEVGPTMTTQCYGYGNGRFGHPEQDRAISLREAAILQTFPPKYQFVPPDSPVRFNSLGRLIGNAVPVRLGEAIGNALTAHVKSNYSRRIDSEVSVNAVASVG